MSELKNKFQALCGQHIRITLLDDRRIYGILSCFDSKKNFVLQDSLEEIDEKYVTKINEKMQIHIRKDNWFLKHNPQIQKQIQQTEDNEKNQEELLNEVNNKWMENKFVMGQVIIPGKQVKKIEQVKGYEVPKKEEETEKQQAEKQN